jgi:lysophospholipase L1-like esterase
MNRLPDNAVVLFQGDSITDAGRSTTDDTQLGAGYVSMAAQRLTARHPGQRIRVINRGISGHRVRELRARWQRDCLDLQPALVSIMIGINDCWRRYDSNNPTPAAEYEEHYRAILAATRAAGAAIIMLEPFLLPCPPDRFAWREDLDPKIDAARRLAREFAAIYIPLDGLFAAAAVRRKPAHWAADGVHPTPAGHAFIADAWMQAFEEWSASA